MAEMKLIVVRTAATELDLQGRVSGRLDLPLSERGEQQAEEAARQLQWEQFDIVLRAPCQQAEETADKIARLTRVRVKVEPDLANIDFGLWHGRRLEDLKKTLPKAYRCWTEHPEYLYPPEGESIHDAMDRARSLLERLARKYVGKSVLLVTPPPMAALLTSIYSGQHLDVRWCHLPADAGWTSLGTAREATARAAAARAVVATPASPRPAPAVAE
jgi:broad specificity phosphatase PhoE